MPFAGLEFPFFTVFGLAVVLFEVEVLALALVFDELGLADDALDAFGLVVPVFLVSDEVNSLAGVGTWYLSIRA